MATNTDTRRPRPGRGGKPTLPDPRHATYREKHLQMLASVLGGFQPAPEIDLRAMVIEVYNQGQYNSCVVNAELGAMKFAVFLYHQQNGIGWQPYYNPSRMATYWHERAKEDEDGNLLPYNAGGYIDQAFDSIKGIGTLSEADWLYGDGNPQIDSNAPQNFEGDDKFMSTDTAVRPPQIFLDHLKSGEKFPGSYNMEYSRIDDENNRDPSSLAQQLEGTLSINQTVVFDIQEYTQYIWNASSGEYDSHSYDIDAAMFDSGSGVMKGPPVPIDNDQSGDQRSYETRDSGHVMLMVGYDRNKELFLVRNSWGEDWGTGGYGGDWGNIRWGSSRLPMKGHFWLPYEWLRYSKYTSSFWTIRVTSLESYEVI